MLHIKKISAVFWILLFIVFGRYQTNDADPMIWVVIYGAATLVSVLVFLDKEDQSVLRVFLIAFVVGAIILWPNNYEGLTLENGYTPSIEEARESLGLLICGLGMGSHLFVTRVQ